MIIESLIKIIFTQNDQSQKSLKKSNSGDNLTDGVDLKSAKTHTINDIDTLKLREIESVNIERIRKKSEKINVQEKSATSDQASRTKLESAEHHDYINLNDCLSKKITLDDFNMVKLIGKGSFGKVFLVTRKSSTNEFYAMKALKKDVVLQDDDVECTMLERDVCKLGNKNFFLTKLYSTFQNEVYIFWFFFSLNISCKTQSVRFLIICSIKGIFVFSYGVPQWWRFDVSHC